MPITISVEQLVMGGTLIAGGVGGYWKLKGKIDSLFRRDVEIEKDIKDSDEEIQKIWGKMLTIKGHEKECEIMNLTVKETIRDSSDAITTKVEETMVDFQKVFAEQLKGIKDAIKENNKPKV